MAGISDIRGELVEGRALPTHYPQWTDRFERFTMEASGIAGGDSFTFAPGNERLNDHGRYLAFVWDGDRLLNEELVRAGLARARLDWNFSNSLKRRLRIAPEEAERAGRGIWSHNESAPSCSSRDRMDVSLSRLTR